MGKQIIPSSSCQIPDLVAIYRVVFGGRLEAGGTFVEIGASDGESHSNTSCLADNGWRGIYVEPVPEQARKCAERHKGNDIIVIEGAVSDFDGEATIRVAGQLSTIQPLHAQAYMELPWARPLMGGSVEQQVRVLTPDRLWDDVAKFLGGSPDLLVLDCEGSEEPVVRSMDLKVWDPAAIIVELRHEDVDFDAFPEIQGESRRVDRMIQDAGYRIHWKDRLNTIYVRLLHLHGDCR